MSLHERREDLSFGGRWEKKAGGLRFCEPEVSRSQAKLEAERSVCGCWHLAATWELFTFFALLKRLASPPLPRPGGGLASQGPR